MKYLIGYHANCNDGLMAAAVMAHAIENRAGVKQDIIFHAMNYSVESEDAFVELVNTTAADESIKVFIVDYCPKHETLVQLNICCNMYGHELTIIDHHNGSIAANADNNKAIEDYPSIEFWYRADMSGCGLAWHYWYKSESSYFPTSVQLIQDRDLWKFEHGDKTRAYHCYLDIIPRTVAAFKAELETGNKERIANINFGKKLLSIQRAKVAELAQNYKVLGMQTYEEVSPDEVVSVAVTTGVPRHIVSEVLHEITKATGLPSVHISTTLDDFSYSISIRSDDDCEVNAQTLAKYYGGGGHPHAAGCSTLSLANMFGYEVKANG